MFTEADHAKAVELYDKYAGEEWFPDVTWHPDGGWCMHHFEFGWIEMGRSHALSAIAWAMVERLGDVDLYHDPDRGYFEYSVGVVGPTRFLALAAAIEDQK